MRNLVFDIDDTLYERITPFLHAYSKIFEHESDLDSQLLYKRFVKHGNDVFEDSMNGTISMEEMWIYRISHALADFQIEITPARALEFQNTYDWYQQHISLSETMIRIFNWCKAQDMKLGIITNGTSAHQQMKYHALQLERWIPKECLLITGDIGMNKPDPRVFEEAQRRMHLNTSETWYIGDSYEHDIAAAKKVGWNVIWLDREHKAESVTDCVADCIVHTEEELEKYIQSL